MISVIIIGGGNRGYEVYGKIIKQRDDIKVVAIAEPNKEKRERFAKEHNLKNDKVFSSWENLLNLEKFADAVIITTPDRLHVEPAIAFMEKGYHLLLEKPIATTLTDIKKVIYKAHKTRRIVLVGHVLRYTPFFKKLKELIGTKIIGKVIGIEHKENIGFFHFAHSFVRGNWRNSETSSPSILAKSCHDFDILYWLIGARCKYLTSFGELTFFKMENQPKGASHRCLKCPESIEKNCPYSAKKIYLTDYTGWPVSTISLDLSYKGRLKSLEEGPYGRCVFKSDNNVVDHQIVNMVFENNVKVTFTMSAFTDTITRRIRIFGTMGEIKGEFSKGEIVVIRFADNKRDLYDLKVYSPESGHGGGDKGIIDHLVKVLNNERDVDYSIIDDSAYSHFMAFAAERSRLSNGKVISVEV